ncbi:MAG: nucleotidyltransferase domain-containing protein [Gemmatales bacterium]
MRTIRRFAHSIARMFHPEKIILFGSHAYGTPTSESDVDLLVVMPCRNRIEQAVQIRWELPAPFPVDLIVRTPRQLKARLKMGDSFLTEIHTKGKVLHERSNKSVGAQSRAGLYAREKD